MRPLRIFVADDDHEACSQPEKKRPRQEGFVPARQGLEVHQSSREVTTKFGHARNKYATIKRLLHVSECPRHETDIFCCWSRLKDQRCHDPG